jgi:hypothetical protein
MADLFFRCFLNQKIRNLALGHQSSVYFLVDAKVAEK